ncbi:MAG: RNA polymerase subunit sigma, partial [Flavobacteriales bacterium]|nr:RNA polymerase subunit sigma [Flavobacteriales bacterium]
MLVQTYQQRLYSHCRRMMGNHEDADDALQNTFLKAWKGLKNFRRESKLYS